MKIVADENIPLVDHYFGQYGDLLLKSGRTITHTDVLDADILLVRAVTPVNENLLRGSNIKFVGSTTAGSDHLDTEWLERKGIIWSVAPGCNAEAVAEYVICVIAALQKSHYLENKISRAGVIGVGHTGSEVVKKLVALGVEVVQCDPLRAEKEDNFSTAPVANFSELDLITLHVPLTQAGKYPTYHLIEKNFLHRQKQGCVLINTSRGAVIHTDDLKQYGKHLVWCLDVWENEPQIDLALMQSAFIATPHIAGYSLHSKYRGIEMIYQAACKSGIISKKNLTTIKFPEKEISFNREKVDWRDVALKIYNPLQTSQQMKETLLKNQHAFDELRKNFIERYEFEFVKINAKGTAVSFT